MSSSTEEVSMNSATKPRVLLDLDQTLISAEATDDYKYDKKKAAKFIYHDMDGYYIVFERPGLQPFLDWLFQNYTVAVWTAASKDYALFIVDKILLKKQQRKLDFIFFSYHCDISSNKKKGSKDLTTLVDIFKLPGYSLKNTVILDDYNEVHKTQPGNCIIAHPFEYTSKTSDQDNFLNTLQPHLSTLRDVITRGESLQDATKELNNKMKK